eukprot:augustus_masked-scaffold_2-processed-gene-21.46-mRNA-1 protein AED:0.87 eAED:1.00 QI:0/-1/0/1/-1/1/1/0/160
MFVKQMCVNFCRVETKLGEIERARHILVHGAQYSNPENDEANEDENLESFWSYWYDFELENGNEQSFKEMLRIKRSVEVQFNGEKGLKHFVKAGDLKSVVLVDSDLESDDEDDNAKRKAKQVAEEVQSKRQKLQEEETDDEFEIELEQKQVPDTVFGKVL